MTILLRRTLPSTLHCLHNTIHSNIRYFALKAGDVRYTKSHEYVKLVDNKSKVRIGISNHAQSELGDVVYVDLPDVDTTVSAGDRFASVESTKAASDVYTPIDITVTKINEKLQDESGLVNSAAETDAWFIEAEAKDLKQVESLMDSTAYKQHCENDKH